MSASYAQTMCVSKEATAAWAAERNRIANQPLRASTPLEIVRVNMHFMLKSNGTGNFNALNDGQGNPLSGYQFANDLVNAMNARQYNVQMKLPPNNTTAVLNKNYLYVLDAVYFVANDAYYN